MPEAHEVGRARKQRTDARELAVRQIPVAIRRGGERFLPMLVELAAGVERNVRSSHERFSHINWY